MPTPTKRALLLARCEGPRPLAAVLFTSRPLALMRSRRPAARWGRSLPPPATTGWPESQPDPGQGAFRRLAEAAIVDPAPIDQASSSNVVSMLPSSAPGFVAKPFQGPWREDTVEWIKARVGLSRPSLRFRSINHRAAGGGKRYRARRRACATPTQPAPIPRGALGGLMRQMPTWDKHFSSRLLSLWSMKTGTVAPRRYEIASGHALSLEKSRRTAICRYPLARIESSCIRLRVQ